METTLQYLARDKLYETEKPYSAEFEIKEENGVKKTNYILSAEPVTVHPIQPSDSFTLDTNGFCAVNANIPLSANEALADPEAVESAYLAELRKVFYQRFPEYWRLEPLDFVASTYQFDLVLSLVFFPLSTWPPRPVGGWESRREHLRLEGVPIFSDCVRIVKGPKTRRTISVQPSRRTKARTASLYRAQ